MPNSLSVEIYIKKADVLNILKDNNVTHILIQGNVAANTATACTWNMEATGYPGNRLTVSGTCPHPC